MGPEKELQELKESLQDTQPVGVLINAAKTLDQVRVLVAVTRAVNRYPGTRG